MYADYHIHTEFSDDSTEPMERQIERAIGLGLEEICFTDHVDYGVKKDWEEGNIERRMGLGNGTDPAGTVYIANVNYPEYFGKILRMKEIYGDRIRIRSGLEFGIQTITLDRFEKLYRTWEKDLDFVLLSIHQVGNREFWNGDFQRGRTRREFNEAYYRELLAAASFFDHYSVLAHLDLIVRYDPEGPLPFSEIRDLVAPILQTVIEKGKGIEINTSSWHYGLADTQPSREILSLYREMGGKIVTIGSDAHTASRLGDHVREAAEILKDLGFDSVAAFEHMEPVFHPL